MNKDIDQYEEFYSVSSRGSVYSKRRSKNLKLCKNKGGYRHVILVKGKVKTTTLVHRLVALAFIENPDNKPCVNHVDGNKTNNRVENLEWVTHSENTQHMFDTGLYRHTEEHKQKMRKFSEEEEDVMLLDLKNSGLSMRKIAKKYNTSHAMIQAMIKRRV